MLIIGHGFCIIERFFRFHANYWKRSVHNRESQSIFMLILATSRHNTQVPFIFMLFIGQGLCLVEGSIQISS